ncbi:MAG TPA: YbjN domain-containing protein [Alphaproteobacteria bacterium]|nr:YbjN domain-containing protein [Alphaproteobacteria bacterium]
MIDRLLRAFLPTLVLLATGASAQTTIVPTYNAIDADTVKKIVDAQGQSQTTVDLSDPQGPIIKVQLAAGIGYWIELDDCDNGQPNLCKSLSLHAVLPAGSLNFYQVNAFNQNMRYATAFFGDKGVPELRMDANLRGGVTQNFIAYDVRIFNKVVLDYIKQATAQPTLAQPQKNSAAK